MRLLPLTLAFLLATSGCARYSANHRMGLMAGGGAATFIGGIIAIDGAYCDDSTSGMECDDGNDRADLISGGILMVAGLTLFGLAYYFKPAKTEPR